ncbi:WD40/YVTN/BNR-like repeat-containing protein [Parachryseolinea silvisoli]|uniref:WD40/YVTN/BNR-like repeat-containing protein n=1 Tax=Parachryseolinea silvisoli TaxID=2873601 RepID=UPI002265C774|nr:hypothetical protein [Parachryseolinea silvisoli]MCD9016030.1 hypothetical protein [Parachryseolinea silvisoli]
MTMLLSFILIALSFCQEMLPGPGKGIVYFSTDNGRTWENTSAGLPDDIFLSDIAAAPGFLGLSTKQHGIFLFNFAKNEWSALPTIPSADEINALYFHQGKILAGTKNNGLFISSDLGKTWVSFSRGLKNLTIRKLTDLEHKVYAGTNGGLYVLQESTNQWIPEHEENGLQVNGMRALDGDLYAGTNRGVFKKSKGGQDWKQIMPGRSLHNLGVDRKNIYALTYSELFISTDKGASWKSDQTGMPPKYTFQVIEKDNTLLAGQWDGVYIKRGLQGWALSNQGLPKDLPVLELVVNGNTIVAGSSQWSQ